jgi:hypothetical protein
MNWASATSLDQVWPSQFWPSPAFPMWLTLGAAGFFGIIVFITLLRAEKSVANGALTLIALLAVGIAVASTIRGVVPDARREAAAPLLPPPMSVAPPALACTDDLAGETVLRACEKALFGSPESAAAAVSYAASQIARLTALGDVVEANTSVSPEILALRRAVERDRYGLMAQALLARDHCTPFQCAAFRALTDPQQIVANMNERVYDGLIARYAPSWNAPPAAVPVAAPLAALPLSVPTGKPTNAEFPTAASTPPVSIMTPEPGTPSASRAPAASVANSPLPSSRPASTTASALAPAAAKKPPAPKSVRASAPVQLTPAEPAPAAAPTAAPTPTAAPAPAAASE